MFFRVNPTHTGQEIINAFLLLPLQLFSTFLRNAVLLQPYYCTTVLHPYFLKPCPLLPTLTVTLIDTRGAEYNCLNIISR